jgi:3-oxoacyl-[acyl-carrier-protein] synthase-3
MTAAARYARITGTGSYLPERILTNADLEKMVDTTDEWIFSRTGIRKRHIIAEQQTTTDMAVIAAQRAIQAAGIEQSAIDLIIFATTTPDRTFPSCACILQKKMAMHECPAFDIQAVCSGFVYALSVADQFVRTGMASCALVIGADAMSRITDWTDRSNCILWGDGAGAVIVRASDSAGILSSHIHADGSHIDLLTVPQGVTDISGDKTIKMEGNAVFKMAVNTLDAIVDETLAANHMSKADIDWLVPHQANIRILQSTAKKLGMSMDRVVVTVDEHGNTSAASIPLALDVAVRDGRIKKDEIILMEAFGGGFTWGSVLLKF